MTSEISNNPLNGTSNENSLKLKERSLAARHSDAWVKIQSHTEQKKILDIAHAHDKTWPYKSRVSRAMYA